MMDEEDIEKQRVFFTRKEMAERAKHYEETGDNEEEADRELNEYEQELMNK